MQKTYTVDFLTKQRIKNNGLVPKYYVENSHEAIIPREIFMQEQEELVRRRLIEKVTVYEDKFTVEFKSGVTVAVDE